MDTVITVGIVIAFVGLAIRNLVRGASGGRNESACVGCSSCGRSLSCRTPVEKPAERGNGVSHSGPSRLACAIILTASGVMPAAPTDLREVEISGFGDFRFVHDPSEGDESFFSLGQAEVDLATSFENKVHAAVAIAYDTGAEHFGLGAFTLDFHILGEEGEHFRRGGNMWHSGVMAGRFDVPFGIDWQVIPSIDRHLVSTPLVVEQTHDGWNDLGIQVYMHSDWINAIACATNGWDHDATDLLTPATEDSAATTELHGNDALGARIGLTPWEAIEIGGSVAYVSGRVAESSMVLAGADLQAAVGQLSLKGEFIAHKIRVTAEDDFTNTGFYVQGLYDFEQLFLVARYGRFSPDIDDQDAPARLGLGAGWRILEGCEMRFEYQCNGDDKEERAFLQLVTAF